MRLNSAADHGDLLTSTTLLCQQMACHAFEAPHEDAPSNSPICEAASRLVLDPCANAADLMPWPMLREDLARLTLAQSIAMWAVATGAQTVSWNWPSDLAVAGAGGGYGPALGGPPVCAGREPTSFESLHTAASKHCGWIGGLILDHVLAIRRNGGELEATYALIRRITVEAAECIIFPIAPDDTYHLALCEAIAHGEVKEACDRAAQASAA